MARAIKTTKTKSGILYVILVELEGKSLVKIGVTHRRIEDRVSEILVGIFKKYREFPYCRPKRFGTTRDTYKKEKALHKHFSAYSYVPSKKFSGSTEFFDIPLEDVVKVYDTIVPKKTKAKPKPKKSGVFFTANKVLKA
tara:strand:+ start:2207 stop:2623 length:417 start_codon:yes stop_codon:yes gene_type:complete